MSRIRENRDRLSSTREAERRHSRRNSPLTCCAVFLNHTYGNIYILMASSLNKVAEYESNSDDESSSIEVRVAEGAESWVAGLNNFLFDTRHLFTLIGVFGAFSIYLRQTNLPTTGPDKVPAVNIVSFFGFGLVLLLLLIVLVKLVSRMLSPDPDDLMLRPENIPCLIFILFLIPIVVTLIQYLSTFPTSAALFWYSFVYLLAPITVFWAHDRLITEIEVHGILADALGRSRYTALALMSLGTALAGLLVYMFISLYYGPNVLDALIAGNRPSQRWLLLVAMFVAFWFYAATAGLLITVVRAVRAGFRDRLAQWRSDNSNEPSKADTSD